MSDPVVRVPGVTPTEGGFDDRPCGAAGLAGAVRGGLAGQRRRPHPGAVHRRRAYRWHPWEAGEDLVRGADAIAAAWLAQPDDPQAWEMRLEPLAVDGDLGVARCQTVYHPTADTPRQVFHNVFLIRLTDDGRCRDFTEFFMREPAESGSHP
jgi:hypothetical protein